MNITEDVWLSHVLARPVFSVHPGPDDSPGDVAIVDAHAATQPPRTFYFAKLTALDIQRVAALSESGFAVIETSLGFRLPLARRTRPSASPATDVEVAWSEPRWHDGVLDIAAMAFRYSRFHMDPSFDRAEADHVKREWIRSYLEGRRGDGLLVAHSAADAVGFCAMLTATRPDGRAAIIDLIGVHPGHQGRGIGRRLVRAAAQHYRRSCVALEVGTQAANIPSVRLYESLGFRLARSGFVLHRHLETAPR